MASNTSNTSNTSRKASPVKVVKVDPAQLVGTLSQDALTALIQSAQAAKAAAQAAKAAKAAVRERINLPSAAQAAAEALDWAAPYADSSELVNPEAKTRFNFCANSPLYDSIMHAIKANGGVDFGDIAQLYLALNSDGKVRTFTYILQQVSNRMGQTLTVTAGKVAIG
jgi:hypothetical protein